MPRKVFLSFLGTNDYVRCNYYHSEFRDKNQKFIQVSLMKMLVNDFSESDKAYFFLTDDAKKRNWLPGDYIDSETKDPNIGLFDYLKELKENNSIHCQIENIRIDNGLNEKEVWNVFQTMYALLKHGDEIYLDVTHAFRYFPILCFSLLNYARALKKVRIQAVYYGAFEKLGPTFEVKKMLPDERNAEILNLVAFDILQQWTTASNIYLQTGNAIGLQKLASERIGSLLQEKETRTPQTQALNLATRGLAELSKNIATNRGKHLLEYNLRDKILTQLDRYEQGDQNLAPAFEPLIKEIKKDIESISSKEYPRWFSTACFCFEKKLYQQCFTQLQEGIKVEVVFRAPKELKLNPFDKKHQEIASQAFTIIQRELPEEGWAEISIENKETSLILQKMDFVKKVQPVYTSLEGLRNDINHGGYTDPTTADRLVNKLEGLLQKTRTVLREYGSPCNQTGQIQLRKSPLFLNHSNHPLSAWTYEQHSAANKWGKVEDLPFPNVPPFATKEEVEKIAEENFDKIRKKTVAHEVVVHVMGELTYTFYIVNRLKSFGISCVASTTERSASIKEDGAKTSTFQFIAFREY